MIIRLHTIIFITAFMLLFFSGCASKNRPAPRGTKILPTPLSVVATSPSIHNTTFFSDNKVSFYFSQWVDPKSTTSIKIYPRLSDYEIKTWAKEIIFLIFDTLIQNQTYVITLPPTISDYAKNKMDKSFQYAFSTGSGLDSGSISGQVSVLNPTVLKDALILAYYLGKDSLRAIAELYKIEPLKTEPAYAVPVDANGTFGLNYLREGFYHLFAISDKNKNFRFDKNEEFAVLSAFSQIASTLSDSLFLRLTPPNDSNRSKVIQVEALSRSLVSVTLDNPSPLTEFSRETFSIRDTVENKTLSVIGFSFPETTPANKGRKLEANTIQLWLNDTLSASRLYKLNASIKSLLLGISTSDFTFAGSSTKENPPFSFLLSPFTSSDSSRGLEYSNFYPQTQSRSIYLSYSKPINSDTLKRAISLYQYIDSVPKIISHKIYFQDALSVFIAPASGEFEYGETYKLKIDSMKIHRSLQVDRDTTLRAVVFKFTVIHSEELGNIEGTLDFKNHDEVVILLTRQKDKFTYTFRELRKDKEQTKKFKISNLPEGAYTLEAFVPKTNSIEWDSGNLFPFRPSKPYFIYRGDLNVRKRWTIENVNVELKE
ncbi:hypothetical protein CHS0354_024033 [Potamilus streckersoni]|uniref:SbsA Ig-like domain-containing protein n=1 Tax=Potamilus streckersoni TaxID=2493646 RepID=A0AAE0RZB2_9BIVA|nr:hypothetical protein CHS0354_024033 [Potamilus streckersoni]